MTLIQILTVVLAALILIKTVSDFRKRKITLLVFMLWVIIWLTAIVIALLPQATGFLDKILGKGRALDAMVYFSIIFILYILFKITAKLEKIESNITTIVKEIALRDKK